MNSERQTSTTRPIRILIVLLILTVGTATLLSSLSPAAAGPMANGTPLYLPYIFRVDTPTPTVTATPGATQVPAGAFANGSFEWDTEVHWELEWPRCRYVGPTDWNTGNQHPRGWDFYSPASDQVMPFPTKRQSGQDVPAISGGQGEYVHRCSPDGPPDEMIGQPRALTLEGSWFFKAFSDHIPHALQFSQTVTGTPGKTMQVTGYILGETSCTPPLEDDTFVAAVSLGNMMDKRDYKTMVGQSQFPGNDRHWNRFSASTTIPADGKVELKVIVQQNWACGTDFFLDAFSVQEY